MSHETHGYSIQNKGRYKKPTPNQDAFAYGTVYGYANLNLSQRKEVFSAAFAEQQSNCSQYKGSGATATVMAITSTHVDVAHVGDTRAYLARRNKKTGEISCALLNEGKLHNVDNPNEKMRIAEKNKLFEESNRLGGALAVTRNIGGYTVFDQFGLDHTNEFTQCALNHDQYEYIAINATDGVSDGAKKKGVSESVYIAGLCKKNDLFNKNKTNGERAKIICETARKDGSTDDITAVAYLIPAPSHQLTQNESSNAILLTNSDGHDGEKKKPIVSTILQRDLLPSIQKHANQKLQQNPAKTAALDTQQKVDHAAESIIALDEEELSKFDKLLTDIVVNNIRNSQHTLENIKSLNDRLEKIEALFLDAAERKGETNPSPDRILQSFAHHFYQSAGSFVNSHDTEKLTALIYTAHSLNKNKDIIEEKQVNNFANLLTVFEAFAPPRPNITPLKQKPTLEDALAFFDITSASSPDLILHALFSVSKRPFSSHSFLGTKEAKTAYKLTQAIEIDYIVSFVETYPSTFSAFFDKTGHSTFLERNFRKEVGARPDLLEKLYKVAEKNKQQNAFADLLKSSHIDLKGFKEQSAIQDKIQHYLDLLCEIKNDQVATHVVTAFYKATTKLNVPKWPSEEQITKFVEDINQQLDTEKGLTKNSYAKICRNQAEIFFDIMTDVKLDKKVYHSPKPTQTAKLTTPPEQPQKPSISYEARSLHK